MEVGGLGWFGSVFLGMLAAFAAVALFKLLPQITRREGMLISKRLTTQQATATGEAR